MSDHKPESEVLMPLSRAELLDKDGAEWPIYTLNHAIVTDEAGSIVSLFDASVKLLVLTGELQYDKERKQNFLIPFKRKPIYVEIRSVARYSYGSYEDGSVAIWAAGHTGWFEIHPAETYSQIYEEMNKAVKSWYHILDTPKFHNAAPKDIIVAFAKKQKIPPSVAETVYHSYARFLVRSMDDDGKMKWQRSPVYQYLKSHQDSSRSSSAARETGIISAGTARQRDMKKRGQKTEPAKPAKKKEEDSDKPGVIQAVAELKRVETEAAILWKFIQRTSELKVRPRQLTLQKLTEHLWNGFVFESPKQAENYVRFQSQNLMKYMQDRRQRKDWVGAPLYSTLISSVLSSNLRGKMAQIQLQAREYPLEDLLVKGGVEKYDTSEEEIETHHTKSSLRPRSAGKKGKSYTAKDAEDEESGAESRASRKRKGKEPENETPRLRKRRALSTAQSSEQSTAEEANGATKNNEQTLPLRWKNDPTLSPNAPEATEGATLSPQSNGPGDVWRCTAPDCMQAIYGASGQLGKQLIDDHIEEHREQERNQPQLDVVMNEMKKTNLPVANLIKKIREFAAAKELSDAVVGAERPNSRKPERIKRLIS